MIFVTVGSHPRYGFQRLLDALGPFPPQDLVVQYGPARAPEGVTAAHAWLTFPQVLGYMNEALTVISHAGAGTILCANNLGHTPVVMPRLKRYRETVDDHQLELARVLERTGRVFVAWDSDQLPRFARRASFSAASASPEKTSLNTAVHAALMGSAR